MSCVQKSVFKPFAFLAAFLIAFSGLAAAGSARVFAAEQITLTGFLIDEHCFLKKSADPGSDTRSCKLMNGCIKGGYGIAALQQDGSYRFYYFDGDFFTDTETLNGTGGQKTAYDFIVASAKETYLPVVAAGTLEEGVKPSTSSASADTYSVLKLNSLREATAEEAGAANLPTGEAEDASSGEHGTDAANASSHGQEMVMAESDASQEHDSGAQTASQHSETEYPRTGVRDTAPLFLLAAGSLLALILLGTLGRHGKTN